MISSRLPADLSPNATARAVEALRAQGVAVVDLTESNPTRAGFEYPAALLHALANPAALRYEPHPLGLISAREAVSGEFARRGLDVSPARIALTASTSEAYGFLFKLFCNPGDAVLVPQPSYPLFDHLTALESVSAVPYALEYHGAWRIDLDAVARAISDRTRAVLIVSPNNPTGSFLHSRDLAQLVDICQPRDIAIVGDEVFADYPLDASPAATPVLAQNEVLTCSLGGLSKSAGLPQLKLGWIGFGGPVAKVRDAMAAYEIIADAYLSLATPVQTAARALLEGGAAVRAQIHARVRANLARLRELVSATPAATVLKCEGGWCAVVRLPALRSEESLVLDLLNEDHVLVHPGYFFDFAREAFAVVSLLVEPAAFEHGVARLLARATTAPSCQ
jgi:aspartate/methionine/tyrosine aminotransferase